MRIGNTGGIRQSDVFKVNNLMSHTRLVARPELRIVDSINAIEVADRHSQGKVLIVGVIAMVDNTVVGTEYGNILKQRIGNVTLREHSRAGGSDNDIVIIRAGRATDNERVIADVQPAVLKHAVRLYTLGNTVGCHHRRHRLIVTDANVGSAQNHVEASRVHDGGAVVDEVAGAALHHLALISRIIHSAALGTALADIHYSVICKAVDDCAVADHRGSDCR